MSSTDLVRWGGLAAVVAGLAYALGGVVELFAPQQEVFTSFSDYLIEVVSFVAVLGTLGAIAGLHALQRGKSGRLGTAGFLTTFVGYILLLVATLLRLTEGRGDGVPSLVLLSLGFLATLVGLVLLGIPTLRAWVLPRWCGVLLIVGLPVGFILLVILGVVLGIGDVLLGILLTVLLAVVWALVGYALLAASRSALVEQPDRETARVS